MHLGTLIATTPTIGSWLPVLKASQVESCVGFNVEFISVDRTSYTFYDLGGTETFQTRVWKSCTSVHISMLVACKSADNYFYADASDTMTFVFVIDATNRTRVAEAHTMLRSLLLDDDRYPGVPLLVLANKQDLPGAMTSAELIEAFGLKILHRPWHVQVSHDGFR
jgi:ADP-ribosylation factor protein 1